MRALTNEEMGQVAGGCHSKKSSCWTRKSHCGHSHPKCEPKPVCEPKPACPPVDLPPVAND
jgi:hypothetical protein